MINGENVKPEIMPLAQPFTLVGNDIGVVLIHGYGGSVGDYSAIAQHLHRAGFTVHGLRLAGHGQGQTALRKATVSDCQWSVAEAVTNMQKSCRHIFLLGSSFGGVLALDYGANHPNVAGLILVNTALSYAGAGVFQGIILRLLRLFTPDYRKKGLSEQDRLDAQKVGSSEAWPINGILATAKFAQDEVLPNLANIKVPALIMHSQNDNIVGSENSIKLANLLGSTNKQTMAIQFGTHRPFRSPESVAFMAEKTQQFIRAVLANKS